MSRKGSKWLHYCHGFGMRHSCIKTLEVRLRKFLPIIFSTLLAGVTTGKATAASPQEGRQDATRQQETTPISKPVTRDENTDKNAPKQDDASRHDNTLGLQTIKNIVRDQEQIWTSPAHVRLGHADWLVPYGGLTAGFLVTDRDASLHLSNSPSTLKHYRDASNYGLAAMGGAVGGLYLWGHATNDPHKEET